MAVLADIEPNSRVDRGLRRYLQLVAQHVGIDIESCWYEWQPQAVAYIALDERVPSHPDRDLALVWDEFTGWCAGIEVGRGDDFVVLAYLDTDVLPAPRVIANFIEELLDDRHPDRPALPPTHSSTRDELLHRITDYALPS